MKRLVFILGVLAMLFSACNPVNRNYQGEVANADFFHRSVQTLTDGIVQDIFSPPVASRNYVYPCIAAYECIIQGDESYESLSGQLHEFSLGPQANPKKNYAFPIAALEAFNVVAKALIFSENKIEVLREDLTDEIMALAIPKDVYKNSVELGQQMAEHVLKWADQDMYKQTRTYPKFTVTDEKFKWRPTPPDYMDAIEPSWREIRTMVLDSAQQFSPPPPTEFSTDPNSNFMKETREVYHTVKNAGEEETAIAQFWDCNPYVSHHKGHVMYATKKITPGGHWMGIAKIACQNTNADFAKTVETYTLTSIALFDAFISCWDEKYRSNLIRPETVINQNIDENWLPLLQTPPFPEHTSGHSVISAAASVALTKLYGDHFSFVDSTEVAYGLPARSFNSFYDASEEAAISRLYGGIHYRPAIDLGIVQGKNVGDLILERVVTKKKKIN